MNTIASVVAVLIGLGLMIWPRKFASIIIRDQNRFWGFNFGEKEVRGSTIVCFVVGLGFVTLSVLSLLGIVEPKPQ
jgi:hypothetical protein